jgi:hypothetical protein
MAELACGEVVSIAVNEIVEMPRVSNAGLGNEATEVNLRD